MNPKGKLPPPVRPGQRGVRAEEFNALIAVARAVQAAVGRHGVDVTMEGGRLVISGSAQNNIPMASAQWARITRIEGNAIFAKVADSNGVAQGEEFRVYIDATDKIGMTANPALDYISPQLRVNEYIRVIELPPCGAARPSGWWMLAPSVDLTCSGGGGGGGSGGGSIARPSASMNSAAEKQSVGETQ